MVMDPEQRARRVFFERHVTSASVGIEIGPSYRPTFPKAEGWKILSVDHLATPELLEKFRNNVGVPAEFLSRIEDVDLVWHGEPYREIPGMPSSLDFVVACHVIEHAPDLIGWLNDCSSILRPGGHLLLAVPSRRLIFDHYRPLSTLGDVMAAHISPEVYDVKAWIDEFYLAATIDGLIAWVPEVLRDVRLNGRAPLPLRDESGITDLLRQLKVGIAPGAPYRDGHRWVFEKESLADLIGNLSAAGLIDFTVEEHIDGAGCEFLMVLSRGKGEDSGQRATRSTLLPLLSPPAMAGSADDAVGILRERIAAMENSTSWKFTAPLRRMSRLLKSTSAHLRRR